MHEGLFYIYILCSGPNGYMYVGHTDNLLRRMYEHKNGLFKDAYTTQHGIKCLAYFETAENREAAKFREAQLKKWSRQRKFHLIESNNPNWQDLARTWFTESR